MPPRRIAVPSTVVRAEPLTRSAFRAFGWVIEQPTGPAGDDGGGVPANQGTATRYAGISELSDGYGAARLARRASAALSLFVCRPRAPPPSNEEATQQQQQQQGDAVVVLLDQPIMERHPYTTQTFSPLGLDAHDPATAYLVVVAPPDDVRGGGPDVARARAFVARGGQAVTYAAGTWHAPMAVLGARPVAFLVLQYANGVPADDCEELALEPAPAAEGGGGGGAGGGRGLQVAVPTGLAAAAGAGVRHML